MHELSLARDIVRRALGEVTARERVTCLGIVVGEEEHVAVEALSIAVTGVSRDTAAEGATVHIRRLPGHGVKLEIVKLGEVA